MKSTATKEIRDSDMFLLSNLCRRAGMTVNQAASTIRMPFPLDAGDVRQLTSYARHLIAINAATARADAVYEDYLKTIACGDQVVSS